MYNKLQLENKNNIATEYLNDIGYLRSLDLNTVLNNWYNDFLNSSAYNQYLKEYNVINYSEYFILNPDFKIIDLIKIYSKIPTADNQIVLLKFLFGEGNGIRITRKRHKYMAIELTKTTDSFVILKNIVTSDSKNITTDPDSKNITAKIPFFTDLTDPNLVNLFFLITNYNTKYDFTIKNNETSTTYYNYDFNHNPPLTKSKSKRGIK
jgi:hypothetical protein